MPNTFTDAEREAIYRLIEARRDVRRGFLPTPIAEPVLARVLAAAHAAPSVGLMQPTRIVVLRDGAIRAQIKQAFVAANEQAAAIYTGERAEQYRGLKLEGICEAPLNLCILSDTSNAQGHGLGRQSMPEMALYSTVCAVQNLWLAARAEGIGIGWVSILAPERLRAILNIPEHLKIVALLCAGYVDVFQDAPELERAGWEQRRSLASTIAYDACDAAW